jgi:uncharacterized SAM-dependent methyltransferase
MKEGDFLLIGNGLDNRHHEEIVNSYSTKEIEDWLSQILTQIGLERNEIEFSVRFNHSRVELSFIMKKDKKISFQDKNIYFSKGDQILVSVSYKYAEHDFKRFTKMYFDDVKVFTAKDKSYTLALCQK